jgi:hypothetical protein
MMRKRKLWPASPLRIYLSPLPFPGGACGEEGWKAAFGDGSCPASKRQRKEGRPATDRAGRAGRRGT